MPRPTLYRKEYAEIARRLCSNDAPSNPELAKRASRETPRAIPLAKPFICPLAVRCKRR